MKKVPEKLGGLNEYKAIKKILKCITYEAVDTKKSESVNAFFDGYVGPTTSLNKIKKENKADFASFNSSHGAVYSIQVSDIVRGKEGAYRKQVVYNVYTNEEEFDIKCSCRLFEFKGIICRHICKVLIERNVKDIPSRYILPRWRKDIKPMHTYVLNCYDDPQTNEEKLRYNKLCSHFTKATELGAESNDKYMFLMKYVDEAIERLMDNPTCKDKSTPMLPEATNVPHQKFLSPLKVRSKGRPPSKRKKSKVEEIITRKKKKAQTKGDAAAQKITQDDHCTQESVVIPLQLLLMSKLRISII
ncbi:FHY3/FAR1 family protein [Dioscorea alata]|uniref:FHY3/FAR1 family protein n=1 Tax=Dioscorea alata TaxID=55571 RepID=A0ACB7WCV6_DIOAL|nr:FHY3/FAR1 family protein [Dioscorea alata]